MFERVERVVRATTLATALMLGGCMSLAPNYERPAAPVPPSYAPELVPAGAAAGAAAAAEIEWQRFRLTVRCILNEKNAVPAKL